MSISVATVGAFDDLSSRHVRLLEQAALLGPVTVLLYSDEAILAATGTGPRFPLAERLYFLRALRCVTAVVPLSGPVVVEALPIVENFQPAVWVVDAGQSNERRRQFCAKHGLEYQVLAPEHLHGFPERPSEPTAPGRKKVVVTGCYDWLHSGHVRFFEEVSHFGDLYVIVGHDANIRLLKGQGHPLLSQQERRYMAGSIRYVAQALVSTGEGWLDADPEIQKIKPDIYAVNQDGDKGGKREYCSRMGIDYRVLNRIPAPGLPQRSSTDLRGF